MVDLVPDIKGLKNREAALRQSEATARTLLNIPSAAIMLLDTNANLIEVNETMAKRFCMTKQEMIGLCLWNILPPQVAELRKGYFAQAVSTGEVVRWEDERQSMWGDNSCIPVLDDRGEVVQIIGFAVDITARKQAEDALQESRQRFQGLVETLYDWIWEVNPQGQYTYVSPRIKDILGYEPEELLGKTPFEIMPGEEVQRVLKIFGPLTAEQKPIIDLENITLHKDGHPVVMETSGLPFYDSKGNFKGYRGTDRDITARKQAEEELKLHRKHLEMLVDTKTAELREAKTYLENIFQTTGEAIIATDSRGYIVLANRNANEMFGYSEQKFKGLHLSELSAKAFEFGPIPPMIEELFARGHIKNRGINFKRKDGSVFDAEITLVLLKDAEGTMQGAVSSIRDITERKQAVAALKKSELHYRAIVDSTIDAVITVDADFIIHQWNNGAETILGYSAGEMVGQPLKRIMTEKNYSGHENTVEALTETYAAPSPLAGNITESLAVRKNGTELPVEFTVASWETPGELFYTTILRDISLKKASEEKIIEKEQELAEKIISLQEANIALKVLVKKSEADRIDLEEKIVKNLNNLVSPYIEKLKTAQLPVREKTYVNILELNLRELTKSFSQTLASPSFNLTNAEIQVASLIREGKISKEIANFLGISVNTVSFHRANIRKKIKTEKSTKSHLKTFLANLAK